MTLQQDSGLTVERPFVCNIIHQQYSHGASVVCRGDCAESFLASRVPYLQLDPLAVQLNGPDLEVDAYRCDEGGCEGVLAEPKQTA